MFFESFDEIANDPKAWVYKGEELEYAADILAEFERLHVRSSSKYFDGVYEHTFIGVMPQVIMLYSFALENFIRALLISSGKIKVNDNGKIILDNNGKMNGLNHNVIEYLEMLNIQVDQKCESVIKMYERHISWEGRYPSPLSRNNYPKIFDKSTIIQWPNTYFPTEDIRNIKLIINRLKEIIEDEIFKN